MSVAALVVALAIDVTGTALALKITSAPLFANALAVAALASATRVLTSHMTGLAVTRKLTLGTRSTRTIAIGALADAFVVVALTIDVAWRCLTVELARGAYPTIAIAVFALGLPAADEKKGKR